MAEEKSEPIANTAAFRAFNTESNEPARSRPSTMVVVTVVVVLAALLIGVLAAVL